jgi:hypothetical protein
MLSKAMGNEVDGLHLTLSEFFISLSMNARFFKGVFSTLMAISSPMLIYSPTIAPLNPTTTRLHSCLSYQTDRMLQSKQLPEEDI